MICEEMQVCRSYKSGKFEGEGSEAKKGYPNYKNLSD